MPGTPSSSSPPVRRRVRWGAVSGAVVLTYVVVYAFALTGLDDRNRFDDWGRSMGSLGARLLLSGVMLAACFHTFDGLRRLLVEVRPSLVRRDAALRTGVLFATWACAVPAAVVLIWPWLSDATG